MFLERRVYQGSSGAVYPYPVVEKILDEKRDKQYQALILENEYLKVMVLPELGGRVQMAYDKIGLRHFIYYNQVVKPSLVGLLGPWISGGIEFNWPQHHRPSTFSPIDSDVEENADSSVSVVVNEIERMTGTKALTRFTLFPDKAYLKISAQLYNRSPVPRTFLWWANPAVKVNDDYESIFPPDVNAVFDHGKRDVSTFPLSTGTYYKVDYSAGVDISRYKNVPVPTSYMAASSKYDFLGCYQHDEQAGMLHVANHHVSPGKKQWTWGNGDFGRAWDRNLTDDDGPYIELMCGVFTDNQPDFSWLAPYEEKRFEQYFLPYRQLGRVHNASKDALVNFTTSEAAGTVSASVKVFTTSVFEDCTLMIVDTNTGEELFSERVIVAPEAPLARDVMLPAGQAPDRCRVQLLSSQGRRLVQYQPEPAKEVPPPLPAEAAPEAEELLTVEQLLLTGLHLEQYRHATRSPAEFYREGLRRDHTDVRCNNALGLWLLKSGQMAAAQTHFKAAVDTLTSRNTNPRDGEAHFNLGVSLQLLGELTQAYDAFFKASWSAAYFSAAQLHLAQIACAQQDYEVALQHATDASADRPRNHQASALRLCLLRLQGQGEEALKECADTLARDPFNLMALFERYLVDETCESLDTFLRLCRGELHNLIECSLDYACAGRFEEAGRVVSLAQLTKDTATNSELTSAMPAYLLAWYQLGAGQRELACETLAQAEQLPSDFCFPNRQQEMQALYSAIALRPADANAHYYLGNYLFSVRRSEEAIEHWQAAVKSNPAHALAHRNLAIAYYNKRQLASDALSSLQTAFSLRPTPRLLMELHQLVSRTNASPFARLALLNEHYGLLLDRDDLMGSYIALLNRVGEHQQALELLKSRNFHPWEGGEGRITGEWVEANLSVAQHLLFSGAYEKARDYLVAAREYPSNLGEGKLPTIVESELLYWLGCVDEHLDPERSRAQYREGAQGDSTVGPTTFYNDQPADTVFYQAACLLRLGDAAAARQGFQKLIDFGRSHLEEKAVIDYFAVSLPDLSVFEEELQRSHRVHCFYLMALGHLGLGDNEAAKRDFERVLELDACHRGAWRHSRLMGQAHRLSADRFGPRVAVE